MGEQYNRIIHFSGTLKCAYPKVDFRRWRVEKYTPILGTHLDRDCNKQDTKINREMINRGHRSSLLPLSFHTITLHHFFTFSPSLLPLFDYTLYTKPSTVHYSLHHLQVKCPSTVQ